MFHVEHSGPRLGGHFLESSDPRHRAQIGKASSGKDLPRPAIRTRRGRFTDHEKSERKQQFTGPPGGDRRGGEAPGRHDIEGIWLIRSKLTYIVGNNPHLIS